MARIRLCKTASGMLAPSSPRDEELLKAFEAGEVLEAKVHKPRNGDHHRKFFALVQLVFENQERYATLEDLLVEIKLKCGHYQEHITTKGRLIYVPKSISFEAMGQEEFSFFYQRAVDVVLKHFMPDTSEGELESMVAEVLRFA